MDFRLYARVLWRFKLLVAVGLVLAAALAALSVAEIRDGGVRYRQAELFSSTTRVGVTQSGFPWGRLLAEEAATGARRTNIPVADPNRLNTLAVLYAELAASDAVRRRLLEDGPLRGKIVATPVVVGDSRVMLPLVDITAVAASRGGARRLAQRAAEALMMHIRAEQQANRVPEADRVVLEQIFQPRPARLFQPRSKTMPVVIFLAILLATAAAAFLLENLRPRPPEAVEPPAAEAERGGVRRSA